jgi:N-sulfoglucosamine sulfohydrolase
MQAPAVLQRFVPFRGLYALALMAGLVLLPQKGVAAPNLLVITVDDMSCDSVGAFGCRLADSTPHIDRLAGEGLRFQRAFVQVGNCMPSRNVMWSGRYPHNTGVEGFYQVRTANYPHLVDLLKGAGYFTAIRGKVSHSTPYAPYGWDLVLDDAQGKPHVKDPASYGESVRLGIERSRAAGKPFGLVINVSDPHKPFYGMGPRDMLVDDPHKPTRIFTPEDVPIPGFLFDHPDVRLELAHYYSSVRRADDCVGEVLKALDESGQRDETLVVFLSDHGMPLPFAKTGLWYHSTRTPLIVRWPGVTRPGAIDAEHLISAVDLLPTLLEALHIPLPEGLDGRSFLLLLRGETQPGRDVVITEYNENAGGNRNPMRGVITRRFLYLYNPWVNGTREFATATRGTITYRTMKRLAPQDPAIAARLAHLERGFPEEFYDYESDPDALHNLIDDPRFQDEIARHRKLLEEWMVRTGDHALEPFRRRGDPAAQEAYMQRLEAEAAERNKAPRRNRAAPPGAAPRRSPGS